LAVGVTVAVVIAIYTYFVIRLQSVWWRERTQAQTVISAAMVQKYIEGVMLSDRHQEVQQFLEELQQSQEIARGRIIKPDGRIIFSTERKEIQSLYQQTPADLFADNRTLHGRREENGQQFAIAMLPVLNQPRCHHCHGAADRYLGAIVLERSMAPAEAAIVSNRNLLIFYGVVIFALVGGVLWLLIVRFVTQPVSNLLQQMRRVQKGDLRARAIAESADEIGELTQGFNSMVISLETTTDELHASHEKQIQQASKLASIGELASGIAHEIRNPLAGIGAAVEVMAEDAGNNGKYAEVVAEMRKQVSRLNTTLHELLDFARQREPEIAPCDARNLIKPMLALVRPDAQKQHVEIVEHYAPDLPLMCGDTQQVQQVILNIALNAIQAMPQGGTLTLTAEAVDKSLRAGHDRAVRISITDTGVGIPRENLHKIFSPFFTTKHRGTGLGLAITHSIVEKHHGAIRVASEPGRGTTFVLEFPACKAAPGESPDTACPESGKR
jgi:signal transduction histidine kinase